MPAALRDLRPAHVLALLLLVAAIVLGSIGGADATGSPTLVDPPGWAFAIWGIVFAGWIAFGVLQLLPSRRDAAWVAAGRWPLVAAALLAGAWINVIDGLPWGGDFAIYAATVGLAASAAWSMRGAWDEDRVATAIATVAASLFAGWVTVATAVSVGIAIRDEGWGDVVGADGATTASLLVAGTSVVAALVAMLPMRPLGYGIAVAWGLGAVALARMDDSTNVALVAAGGAALVLAIAAVRTVLDVRAGAGGRPAVLPQQLR